jgi:hypothetical protein
MKYEVGKAPEQCSGRRRYFFFAFARVAVFFFAGAFFTTFLAAFFTIAALLAIMMAVVEQCPRDREHHIPITTGQEKKHGFRLTNCLQAAAFRAERSITTCFSRTRRDATGNCGQPGINKQTITEVRME